MSDICSNVLQRKDGAKIEMQYDLNSLNRNTKKYNYFNGPISSPIEDVSVFGHPSALLQNSGNNDESDEENNDEHDYEYYDENDDEISCFATELRDFSLFHIDAANAVDNDDDDNGENNGDDNDDDNIDNEIKPTGDRGRCL